MTDSGWILKRGNMYGSNRGSEVREIKMSELFQETAEKFIIFLKDAESKAEKQDERMKEQEREKEGVMLEMNDKVKENERLIKENKRLKQLNKQLRFKEKSLINQVTELNEKLNHLQTSYGLPYLCFSV